jgi:homoserine kinase
MDEIVVKTPATSANLGSGFDICGIALEKPYDLITVKKSPKMVIKNTGPFIALDDPEKSIFSTLITRIRKDYGFKDNFHITIQKYIPHKGGLGSSASESVGIAFGLSKLFHLRLSLQQIVDYASYGEEFIDGSRHLDNVAPCAYGGFTISLSNDPVFVKRLPVPDGLVSLLILPAVQKPSTKFAREILPELVNRKDANYNNFCLAKLICGFMDSNIGLIIDSLDDRIVEPPRAKAGILVNLMELKAIGKTYGYGIAASGAGPAIIALGDERNKKKDAFEAAIKKLFVKTRVNVKLLWTRPTNSGVSIA